MRCAVDVCRRQPAALAGLESVYLAADRAVSDAGLVCMGGGGCCRFDLFGHRLYVTALELALLTTVAPPGPARADRCAYQVGPRCSAHARRPLGCRVFFCSVATRELTESLYERLHARLREIHATHDIPYIYADLCRSIADCGLGR